ncbi:MAG TPA: bifunctional 4-hydroxy-2-oxoglutarate aldolase/2-dehydro-3-deoxy-phosphogluconate aldolase, partial [Ohtaekwangia sp.]|nr:bifunctional 4-hydroxy-2-oxoglutarate aldolase/2-dehydro-3-deoxy-phosphogluconate aldolase [Ohtaekwangia sp.]
MSFTKQQITDGVRQGGLVPLFTHDNAAEAGQVLEAAYRGGIRVFEFTNRKKNSFEVFSELLRQRDRYPDLMLGIGTVMDAATTKKFIDAGADFIIAPIMKPEMAEVCHAHNKHWIPGCATLTEIVTAKDHGAEVIKVFPGSVLGPAF